MATQRITNEMRQSIVSHVIKHTFKEREATLEVEKTKAADAIYAAVHGQQEATARLLPREWLDYDDMLRVKQAEGKYNNSTELRMSQDRPLPSSGRGMNSYVVLDKDHPARRIFNRIVDHINEVDDAKMELMRKMNSLLRSTKTFKQLEEAWPEGKAFYTNLAPAPQYAVVPATLTHEINRMLGLEPTGSAKKAISKAMSK